MEKVILRPATRPRRTDSGRSIYYNRLELQFSALME